MNTPPKLFISYSHDNECHKEWACDLTARLRGDGVDVILDQWELKLGRNVAKFMETELTSADRILVICSEEYVKKTTNGKGGAGYEGQILTTNLIKNQNQNRVIPIIYSNSSSELMPSFLTSRYYADFRQNENVTKNMTRFCGIYSKSLKIQNQILGQTPLKQSTKRKIQLLCSLRLNMFQKRYRGQ